MTYRGTIKDGVVVLEPGAKLPEGTEVRVEAPASLSQVSPKHFHSVEAWDGPPREVDRLLQQVQESRETELAEDDDGSLSA
jgi:hypothetical protein